MEFGLSTHLRFKLDVLLNTSHELSCSYVTSIRQIRARGGVDVLYYSQIVENGDPKSEGGANEPLRLPQLTAMSRPQEIQVGRRGIRRGSPNVLRPGTRSGAEASSPTGDAGCLGTSGRRRLGCKSL